VRDLLADQEVFRYSDVRRHTSQSPSWLEILASELVPDATVVLSSARPGAVPVDIDQLTLHFKARVRDVVVIPFDDHLAEGAEISMDLLNRKTRQAFLDLTASVAEGFNRNRRVPRLR
jgi:MinD-like ATPase involved in chromosome partitioning or flagellar assembly